MKETLLNRINELEIKAEVYSNTDWDEYCRCIAELNKLDRELLDIYNRENETFLQNIARGA